MNATTDPTDRVSVPAAEEAQARAYLTAAAAGFGILFEHWVGWGDGGAITVDGQGNRLMFTGDELHPFDAVIPCARHRYHRTGVTYPHEFDAAITATAECSKAAPPRPHRVPDPVTGDTPTLRLRRVVKPTPLWLITHAADIPGRDRKRSAS
ncbi:hypothetical protein ACIA7S_28595 [Streptomyces sp. NPDC051643]|uniref:hypothetical protein n=1 Tax=Streptomyces sp. NPDC051643 TaxID=3365665 RepID=UPI0037B45A17